MTVQKLPRKRNSATKKSTKKTEPVHDIDLLYREEILDHYRRPHHFGHLTEATACRRETNFSCGDDLEFCLKIGVDGKVQDVTFNGRGCAVSVAAASMLSDMVIGRRPAEIRRWNDKTIMKMLGVDVGAARIKCALLGLRAVQVGLDKQENNK